MKAIERTLEVILHSSDQYVIPVFQRYYVWSRKNWQQLWEDVQTLLEPSEEKSRHFLGSIVTVPLPHQPGTVPAYQVIDGQQRLTTFSVLLCAIRDTAKGMGLEEMAAEVSENYILHKFKKGVEHYRIYPRLRDRNNYLALADGSSHGIGGPIGDVYSHYLEQIGKSGFSRDEESLRRLFNTVANRLDLVMVTLNDEDPYKIFKSLNFTGVDLKQCDLIRNYVFMATPLSYQDEYDEKRWQPLEEHFKESDKLDADAFTSFFRDMLMSRGKYVSEDGVFAAFEAKYPPKDIQPDALSDELDRYVRYYDWIRCKKAHSNPAIATYLMSLHELKSNTPYPLLLLLLESHEQGNISDAELLLALRAIAGFIFRRYIANESSRPYSRLFPTACGEFIRGSIAGLLNYLGDRGWPDDDKFKQAFQQINLAESDYARPVLEGLEMALQRGESVSLTSTDIEHIMPQTIQEGDENGKAWISSLGLEWERIHKLWLHTPGNLTLVLDSYNRSMKNAPFSAKKLTLASSKTYLNEYFSNPELASWDGPAIQLRAAQLADLAAKVWIGPQEALKELQRLKK